MHLHTHLHTHLHMHPHTHLHMYLYMCKHPLHNKIAERGPRQPDDHHQHRQPLKLEVQRHVNNDKMGE